MRVPWLALLLLVIGFAPLVGADLDQALDLVEQGDAAREAGRYDDAITSYRQALGVADGCVPARYGLGAALLAKGETKDAVVAFRQVVRMTGPDAPIPVAWHEFGGQARKQLKEHDKEGKELERLVDAHVRDVMKVAVKYLTKDPDLADRALRVVLTLRPEHKRANELRSKLSDRGARRVAIFDGKQIEDWDGGRGQWWNVVDGVIVGETEGVATFIRNQKEIEGDYDVVMEARIAKAYDAAPFLALMAGWKAEYDHSRFGPLAGALTWYEHRSEEDKERVFRCEANRLDKPIDPEEWTVYELRYRNGEIQAAVNGRVVHTLPRSEARAGGYVGVLAQGCRAEIKRLDVLYR